MAYGLTRPNKPSNPTQRQALLNASSATELLVVLPGPYTAPDYSQSLAELKADLYTAQSENASLTRWLDTLAIENADLGTRMKVAEKQVADLEADAKHSANHVASLCKVIALSEPNSLSCRDREVQSRLGFGSGAAPQSTSPGPPCRDQNFASDDR
ncbi:hypothetical protein GQ600_25831 [Phytophthora cactorum]|nr:hypothetical protein GQ600_25831 [Phytophthora cactorum]